MKSFLISLSLFVSIVGGIVFAGLLYLVEPGPEGKVDYLYTNARLFLYRYSIVDALSQKETKLLYESTCTRRCHSRDVIERQPRTAREWEWIVAKMKAVNKADITEREKKVVLEYLKKNYLSNVPTILPEDVMRFLKKYLWRSDFGEDDIYIDIIYIPESHYDLLQYLGVNNPPAGMDNPLFIVFINTHQGVLPPWNLAEMSRLRKGRSEVKVASWRIIYDDGQNHHRQGILTFPAMNIKSESSKEETLEVGINLPGMKERVFQWRLPIPSFDLVKSKPLGGRDL